MGKIRETFRLVADERSAPPAPAAEPEPPRDDAEPMLVDMPFIEIGPRREVDGSPDVMACPAGPRPPLPAPHHVLFRTLPPAAPRLAEVPRRARFAPELVAYHAPGQPAAARYADLLAGLTDAARGRSANPANVYCFTATRPGVGATTALLNLAVTAARQGSRVVAVDANLRRPGVADRVGLEAAPGLTEVLTGAVALADAIRPTAQDDLSVLSAGAPAAVWADPAALRQLLADLAREADLVLVDGPPWDGRGAAAALASLCGAAFLVAPASEAEAPPASELVAALPGRGVPLAGCILTVG